ncbi:MAG TPA: hypothetical protein EYH57_02880 [Sulfurovum sp.]|nr:hypothetical protein [Sulfurovum sp.]
MKNLLESFAVLLVGLLSLLIVYFIVQYNMIEDQVIEDVDYTVTDTKDKAKDNYLDNLEDYGDDEDIDVDATEESTVNTVEVRTEEKDHDLEDVVDDKSKSSYMKNLENYADTAKKEKLDEVKPDAKDHAGEPEKLEQEEIVDEVGMAIDSALNDL